MRHVYPYTSGRRDVRLLDISLVMNTPMSDSCSRRQYLSALGGCSRFAVCDAPGFGAADHTVYTGDRT